MAKKASSCVYCQGGGLSKGFWDVGYRRTVGSDANSKRVWENTPRYACDRCGLPKTLPPAPLPMPERK